jgi:FkbM family methyltransferase
MSHPDQAFGDRTYSQFGEDLILLNIFAKLGIKKGRYFDVGAHHPYNISNTALLYERGWRGVCIEANENLIAAFEKARPEDRIMCVGINPNTAFVTPFYMIDDYSGRNSFDKETVNKFVKEHPEFSVSRISLMSVVQIDLIFKESYVPDLLSIDIEGLDYAVLESMEARPWVICVENEGKVEEFDNLLKSMKYDKIFNTIGNGIYLHESCH